MIKWNKYLVIGIAIWFIGKFANTSQTAIIYVSLIVGLCFVSYGLFISFKDKKKINNKKDE